VIENPAEKHDVECANGFRFQVRNIKIHNLNIRRKVCPRDLKGLSASPTLGTPNEMVRSEYAFCATTGCLETVESVPATDVENTQTPERLIKVDICLSTKRLDLYYARSQKPTAKVDLVKPPQRIDPLAKRLSI
jgi:hypothetical protein